MTNFDIQRSAKDIEQRADAIKATAAAVLKLVEGLPEGEAKFALNAKVEGIVTSAAHISDSARLVGAANERP